MAIKKMEDDLYHVDIRNVHKQRLRQNFERKQDAVAYEAMIRKEKYDQTLINIKLKKTRYLFNDVLCDFEATKSMLRPKSIQKYGSAIRQIKNFATAVSIRHLDQFTSDHATLFYNELIKERQIDRGNHIQTLKAAPKTINFYLTTLKAFFNEELIKDHIQRSPAMHLKLVKTSRKRPDYYSIEELDAFFAQDMSVTYRNFFIGLLYSGMRYGEASNLLWDDIDFDKRLIFVRERESHSLKTPKSERAIPMNDHLYQLLSNTFASRTCDYVFPNGNDEMIKERRALRTCKEIAVKAGITTRVYLHKFRSTYATLLIRNNVSLESIKELLGHASLIETEKAYANNESNHLHMEVKVLDGLLKDQSTVQ